MALTTNYAWEMPDPGADNGTWGPILNTCLQDIDTELFAVAGSGGGGSGTDGTTALAAVDENLYHFVGIEGVPVIAIAGASSTWERIQSTAKWTSDPTEEIGYIEVPLRHLRENQSIVTFAVYGRTQVGAAATAILGYYSGTGGWTPVATINLTTSFVETSEALSPQHLVGFNRLYAVRFTASCTYDPDNIGTVELVRARVAVTRT